MDSLRQQFNSARGNTHLPSWRDGMSNDFKSTCPSLSYETRLYGFLLCLIFGALLSGFGTVFFFLGRIKPFAIYYSVGSLVGLFSSFFIVGPMRQCSLMFSKNRWIATSVYICLILATLYVATQTEGQLDDKLRKLLIILCIVLQYLAAMWYGLSFIPFGRTVMKNLIAFTCCGDRTALD